ncbi:AMP-dependent synthetase [Nocardioides sp. Soil797]|nr:AMP-dependent synthetase [Nocardioides sp. Soil797]
MHSDEDFDVETLRGRRADRRWNRMSVGDILERVTWSTPDKTALVGWEGAYGDPRFARMTYREADDAANQTAHALLAEGLSPGDRVLLYCDNSVEAIILFFGIAKAGMVAVPVNSLLADDVLAHVLDHVDVSLVVADAGLAARGDRVFAERNLRPAVTISIGGETPAGSTDFATWIGDRATDEVDVTIHSDDIWALLFTSGTTSMPKASMTAHSYSYLSAYSYAMSLTRGLDYETDLVMASFLPIIYHCGHNSTVMPTMLSGGTVVIGRRPDAQGLADAVTREKVTAVWAGSPLWVEKLVEEAEARPDAVDLSSLTVVMFSWGAMTPDLFPRLKEAAGGKVSMLEVFGQTESQSCFRFWPDAHPERAAESFHGVNHVGVPTPLLAADVHDPSGSSLRGKVGAAGEAVYRSPMITAGYYRNLEATQEAFRDGWFHSGDSCTYVAEDEHAQVMVDRLKDVVKSGGENVSSIRVEGVLATHPAVGRVAVVGLPDEKWGELVTAVVIPAEGSAVNEQELIAWARERLAGYETPKRVVFAAGMPETVGGKVRKHELRAQLTGS